MSAPYVEYPIYPSGAKISSEKSMGFFFMQEVLHQVLYLIKAHILSTRMLTWEEVGGATWIERGGFREDWKGLTSEHRRGENYATHFWKERGKDRKVRQ